MTTPAAAGPTARATLKAAELRATALATMPRGTRSGTSACAAGRLNASAVPSTSPRPSSRPGVIRSRAVRTAIAAAAAPIATWDTSITRARSNMSATTPAIRARNSSGSRFEATMSPTQVAEASVNSFISHDAATVWKKDPRFEKIPAIQRARYRGWRSGAIASFTMRHSSDGCGPPGSGLRPRAG